MALRKRLNTLLVPIGLQIIRHNLKTDKYQLNLYKQYSYFSLVNKLFLNVGAGNFKHPYWTNVDKLTDHYSKDIDITSYHEWDILLLKPISYSNNSIEIIYTSHTLEHITDEAALWFMQESYRILKPGGILRILLPDIELAYNAYNRKDRDYFRYFKLPNNKKATDPTIPLHHIFLYVFASSLSPLSESPEYHFDISEEEFDTIIAKKGIENALEFFKEKINIETQEHFPGNHINWYTGNKLIKMLKKAGFISPYISGFGQSLCPVLRDTAYFDKQKLQKISLYVEAIKE